MMGEICILVKATKMIIAFCKEPHSAKEIMDYIKINDRSFFRRHYLNPMIKTGQLKMTIPDKPKSGNQKYYAGNKKQGLQRTGKRA